MANLINANAISGQTLAFQVGASANTQTLHDGDAVVKLNVIYICNADAADVTIDIEPLQDGNPSVIGKATLVPAGATFDAFTDVMYLNGSSKQIRITPVSGQTANCTVMVGYEVIEAGV